MSGVEGRLVRGLANKQRVITRAVFWKISHKARPSEVHLKKQTFNV